MPLVEHHDLVCSFYNRYLVIETLMGIICDHNRLASRRQLHINKQCIFKEVQR